MRELLTLLKLIDMVIGLFFEVLIDCLATIEESILFRDLFSLWLFFPPNLE